jgi:hypothetical protein
MSQRKELPAPTDRAACQEVIAALERWKKIAYPSLPGKALTPEERNDLTKAIVAWRDRYARHFDVSPLEEVWRILRRRHAGESTPEDELVAAAERAAGVCDRIKDWLASGADSQLPTIGQGTTAGNTDDIRWLSLAEAERISGINRGTISKAVESGKLRSNGQKGKGKLKVEAGDFSRWVLERTSKPERIESTAKVEKLVRRHVKD